MVMAMIIWFWILQGSREAKCEFEIEPDDTLVRNLFVHENYGQHNAVGFKSFEENKKEIKALLELQQSNQLGKSYPGNAEAMNKSEALHTLYFPPNNALQVTLVKLTTLEFIAVLIAFIALFTVTLFSMRRCIKKACTCFIPYMEDDPPPSIATVTSHPSNGSGQPCYPETPPPPYPGSKDAAE